MSLAVLRGVLCQLAALGTCSVSPCTTRWFTPSGSQGMLAAAFGVRSVCWLNWRALVGRGVGGASQEEGRSHCQVLDRSPTMPWWQSTAGRK